MRVVVIDFALAKGEVGVSTLLSQGRSGEYVPGEGKKRSVLNNKNLF
jgi:hypothetical protein